MNEFIKLKRPIKDLLSGEGYIEVKPDTKIDDGGSEHCIYASGEKRFMIQWDGEEGFGSVESWQGSNTWIMLEPIVPVGTEQDFNRNLQDLCGTIKCLLNTP